MFTIDIADFIAGVENEQRRTANIIRDGTARAVMRGVAEGANEARTKHTFKNQSGNLEKSIEGVAFGWKGDVYEALIRADMPYASFVEEGTRDHIIEARKRKALHFEWSGEFVFFRRVHHPGTKPMPFMGLAYVKAERVIIREIEISVVIAQEALDR